MFSDRTPLPSDIWVANTASVMMPGNAVTVACGTGVWFWKSFTVVVSMCSIVVGASVAQLVRSASPTSALFAFAFSVPAGLLKPTSAASTPAISSPLPPPTTQQTTPTNKTTNTQPPQQTHQTQKKTTPKTTRNTQTRKTTARSPRR